MWQYWKKLTLSNLVNVINNLFGQKKLLILIGTYHLIITATKNSQIIDSITIKNEAKDFVTLYQKFLHLYKKHSVTILFSDRDCKLQHEIMPVVGPAWKHNPVNNFVEKHFPAKTLTAHHIYEINEYDEIWYSSIASRHCSIAIEHLLEYIFHNSFHYNGSYFLSLELGNIIEMMVTRPKNKQKSADLEIFVTITKASGIILAAKYEKQILELKLTEYPENKSAMYVQGTIEQIVSDLLIKYKNFIKENHLDIFIITLSNAEMQNLLINSSFRESGFTNYQILALHPEDIKSVKIENNDYFQDHNLIKLFSHQTNSHLATNSAIRSITKLLLFNKIIFRPLFGLIIIGIFGVLANWYYQFRLNKKIASINQNYYTLSKEYREIKDKYPDLTNIGDLIELYNLEKLVSNKVISPLADLKIIYNSNFPTVKIKKLVWNRFEQKTALDEVVSNLEMVINYEYRLDQEALPQKNHSHISYFDWLKTKFTNYQLTYQKNQDLVKYIGQKTIIPAEITIKGLAR